VNPDLIPAVDAAGLPAPPWLFHILLVFTFFLHLVFMNLALGGSLLAAFANAFAGPNADDPKRALASRMMGINAYGISLAITTGVAPLLFIQALYHQFFYTGTILVAGLWFAFLFFLMVGYYAATAYKLRGPVAPASGLWLWTAAILFVMVAVVHVVVHLVHVQPGSWVAFEANPWAVLGDPTFVPRLLHYVLGAIGFSALLITWWAVRKANEGEDVELNTGVAKYAWKWVLWTTVLTVVDGFILLIVLPQPVLSGFMKGGPATMIPLTLGIILAVGLLMMISRASNPVQHAGLVSGVFGTMVATIAIMSVTRHQLRLVYLGEFADTGAFTLAPQWLNFGLFVVILVLGLGVVAFMVKRVLSEPATGEEAA
jgi:hypothetical protein